MDNKSWKEVLKRWTHPTVTAGYETTSLKPDAEDNEGLGNSKALNVIFNGVDRNVFRLINTFTEAKEV
jgi:hypothetical protein